MLGMRPEDVVGRCVWDLFPHAEGTKFYEGYHHAVEIHRPKQLLRAGCTRPFLRQGRNPYDVLSLRNRLHRTRPLFSAT